jgi:hypothetical protein
MKKVHLLVTLECKSTSVMSTLVNAAVIGYAVCYCKELMLCTRYKAILNASCKYSIQNLQGSEIISVFQCT